MHSRTGVRPSATDHGVCWVLAGLSGLLSGALVYVVRRADLPRLGPGRETGAFGSSSKIRSASTTIWRMAWGELIHA